MKIFWFAIFVVYFFQINLAFSQDISNLVKQKPFDFSGGISLNTISYGVTGIPARNKSFDWTITGNPNLQIYGIQFPFSFIFSSQNKSYTQPFNRFGLSPYYKWLTLHLGYTNLNFSPFTLSGTSILGAGLELKPKNFRFSAVYGQISKAVSEDSLSRNIGNPAFQRLGYSIKVGIGNRSHYVDLIYLKAWDVVNSIPISSYSNQLRPGENMVLGLLSQILFFKKLSLQLELAGSLYTLDTQTPLTEDATIKSFDWLFEPHISTQLLSAAQVAIKYRERYFDLGIKYKRIDPDYKSMGAHYFQSDLESISIEPAMTFFKQKVRLNSNIGIQQDNLLHSKLATTKRLIYSGNLSINPTQRYGCDIQYSNYGTAQKAGRRPINEEVRISMANQNFNMVNRVTFSDSFKIMNISLMTAYQELVDHNTYTSALTESKVLFANLALSMSLIKSGWSFNLGLAYNQNEFSKVLTKSIGPSIGGSNSFFKNKLTCSVNVNFQQNFLNSQSTGNTINVNVVCQFQMSRKQGLSFNLSTIQSGGLGIDPKEFTEYRISLGYTLRFK